MKVLKMTVDEVVDDVISKLSYDDKRKLKEDFSTVSEYSELSAEDKKLSQSPYDLHFSLGLCIRNNYIYSGKLNYNNCNPDDVSLFIINKIIIKLRSINL